MNTFVKTFDLKGKRLIFTISFFIMIQVFGKAQSFLIPSDTLNKKRYNTALIFTATTYTAFSIGLYNTWYKKFEQEPFHLFNDWGEWGHMDKLGHVHTAYLQGVLCFQGARWTGLSKKKSILTGMVCGTLFQSTIEVMDGFSSKWGFSIPDMAANLTGTSIFALQQHYWDEQRISIKVSSIPKSYSRELFYATNGTAATSAYNRANDLFGANFFERFLKDYNAQTYWASVNVHSFLHEGNKWPKWLNVAVGHSAENMYGGYNNTWEKDGLTFSLDDKYPRYHQFYLGLDVDLPKLNPKNPFLKTICSVFNIFKIPSPALEINTQGQIQFHILR